MPLAKIAESRNQWSCYNLCNRGPHAQVFNKNFQENIVQQNTHHHHQKIAEQLNAFTGSGLLPHHIPA